MMTSVIRCKPCSVFVEQFSVFRYWVSFPFYCVLRVPQ
jgi:hypothetical protein